MKNRIVFVAVLLFFCVHYSRAQYADLGSGNLKNEIWWFDWAGFTVANGASKTFNTADGSVVTITFSNVSAEAPVPDVMNTWNGAVLHDLYDFSNTAIQPALHSRNSSNTITFTLHITATRDGAPAPFTFVGADAEGSISTETTTFTTDGGNWQTLDFFRNSSQTSNPLSGCNTQIASINNTWTGVNLQEGQNPMIGSKSATGSMDVTVTMQRAAAGGMAVALGIFAPIDRGDLPASYGYAQHQLVYEISNPCNYLPPLPIANQSATLHLGAVAGDADPVQTTDDNAVGLDEEGVITFNPYTNNGQYMVQVLVANNTGANAFISGWFDYNRNGVFDNNEKVVNTVGPSMNSIYFYWNVPSYLPVGSMNGYAFRFRISSDMQAVQSATGYAPDGEVEDYFVPDITLCAPLNVTTIEDTTICEGQSVRLTTTSNAIQYSWVATDYLNDAGILSPTATPPATTKYVITASTPQGCAVKDSVTITVNTLSAIVRSADVTLCPGTTTQLSATATGALAYSWSPVVGLSDATISDPVAAPASTTNYIVTATAGACIKKDSILVTVLPPPSFTVSPAHPALCKTQSTTLTATGGIFYTWLQQDGTILGTTASVQVTPDSSQTYRVQITDACGATSTLSVPVEVDQPPRAVITKSNDIDCSEANAHATLHVTGGNSYVWEAAPGITSLTAADQVVSPTAPTTYYVTVTNSNGCVSKDSVTVQVDLTKGSNQFAMPNAFTPNNDGKNDCFGIKNWSRVTDLQLEIFNRWGQRIFTTSNPTDCWDGQFKGMPQPVGGYPYIISATTICGKTTKKGIVMLVR